MRSDWLLKGRKYPLLLENIVIVTGINELKASSCALLTTRICVMILKTILTFCALYGGNILEFFLNFPQVLVCLTVVFAFHVEKVVQYNQFKLR